MTGPAGLVAVATEACQAVQASRDYLPGDRVFVSVATAGQQAAWYARGYPPGTGALAMDLACHLEAVVYRDEMKLGDVTWSSSRPGAPAQPPDRLTRLCAAAENVLEQTRPDRVIVSVTSPRRGQVKGRSGMAIHGYDTAGDEMEVRQLVAWDLSARLHGALGLRPPRPVPGSFPAPPQFAPPPAPGLRARPGIPRQRTGWAG